MASAKLKSVKYTYDGKDFEEVRFHCPGCDSSHTVRVAGPGAWEFNGDHEKPTFKPSVLLTRPGDGDYRCHSFVTDGQIRFLSDCHHELKNQTVDLPAYTEK